MDITLTAKSRNLINLSKQFPVPPFVILRQDDPLPENLITPASLYIVRGCIVDEDQPGHSMAGQGMTIGPIKADKVRETIYRIFHESNAVECILQEYVDGPSGVLICTSPEKAVLEYSNKQGGVTGGKISPFTAIFPNSILKYSKLNSLIPAFFREYGTCDVELINPVNPVFVQIRPYKQDLIFDEQFLYTKMMLQELDGDYWIQSEFCTDLLESPDAELSLIDLYCKELTNIANALNSQIEQTNPSDFIKIGSQIFVRDKNTEFKFKDNKAVIFAGQWLYQEYNRIKLLLHTQKLSSSELMRGAIVFRTFYDMLERLPCWVTYKKRKEIMEYRNVIRKELLDSILRQPFPAYIDISKRLKPVIEKNSQSLSWLTLEYVSENGVIIIPGDFDEGPWIKYNIGDPAPSEKCFLITDELYPEIYQLFTYIKGIICKGGGINSHLAILARESKIPLWIQLSNAEDHYINHINA